MMEMMDYEEFAMIRQQEHWHHSCQNTRDEVMMMITTDGVFLFLHFVLFSFLSFLFVLLCLLMTLLEMIDGYEGWRCS